MKRIYPDFTVEDLVSMGQLGLVDAAKRFDKSLGVKFTTFAYKRITGEIRDGVRNFRPGKRARQKLGNPNPSSLDKHEYDPESDCKTPFELAELKDQAEYYLSMLNLKEQIVFRMKFWGGLTYPSIAIRLGLSTQRIQQLYTTALLFIQSQLS